VAQRPQIGAHAARPRPNRRSELLNVTDCTDAAARACHATRVIVYARIRRFRKQRLNLRGLPRALMGALALCWTAHVTAQVPVDPAAFTIVVMQAMRGEGSIEVSSRAPLELRAQAAPRVLNVSLEALHHECVMLLGFCRDAIRRYVEAAHEALAGPPPLPDASHLRVLLRTHTFVQELLQAQGSSGTLLVQELLQAQGSSGTLPLVRPYVGDLYMILALAGDSLHWLVAASILEKLGLTESAAFELGVNNTRAALPRLSHVVRPYGSSGFSYTSGNIDSSRLLMHDDWRRIAEGTTGELLIVVPDQDKILFGVIQSASQLHRFKHAAAEATRSAERWTPSIYRWTASGWEMLSDEQLAADHPSSTALK
jgi:hypothetical protein